MSKTLSELIFHNKEAYITSPFGYRKSFGTSAGATSSFHNGVDYGTNCKKIPQYAIEDGYIYSCGCDYAYGGAKFVWVVYPKLSGGDYIDPEKWFKNEYTAPAAKKKYTTGNYKVTKATVLNVRKGAGTKYAKKTFSQLTKDAQKKILKLTGEKCNGYVKGLTCTVSKIKGSWGKTPSGWICLDYCERV